MSTTSTSVRQPSTSRGWTGTGHGGTTVAGRPVVDTGDNKRAPQKLFVHGDSIKCNITNGHVDNTGTVRFVGKCKSSAKTKIHVQAGVDNKSANDNAAVTIAGSMKLSFVSESMTTNGIEFIDEDEDEV